MRISLLVFHFVLLFLVAHGACAQQSGDTVVQRTDRKEDVYLAGGSVYQLGKVDGDVVAAGGQVTIENEVTGDVLAAGGNVAVRGRVGDDVRAAGGNVMLNNAIGDDVIAAGGAVMLSPSATVRGRAWLAGGNVGVYGKIGKELRAAGQHVVIDGEINGNVDVAAETLEIRANAVIAGNVHYRSPNAAKIDEGAKIGGTVTREETADFRQAFAAGVARIGFYLSLILTAIVLHLLFPTLSLNAARMIHDAPWKSLGLGLALLAAAPLAIALLFISLIGATLAFVALAFFLLLLLLGFLTGALYLGNWGLRRWGKGKEQQKLWRALALAAALAALWIISFIPVLGGLTTLVVLLFGLGALALELWRRYTTTR